MRLVADYQRGEHANKLVQESAAVEQLSGVSPRPPCATSRLQLYTRTHGYVSVTHNAANHYACDLHKLKTHFKAMQNNTIVLYSVKLVVYSKSIVIYNTIK